MPDFPALWLLPVWPLLTVVNGLAVLTRGVVHAEAHVA